MRLRDIEKFAFKSDAIYFNSTIVRLRATTEILKQKLSENFNSTIVRLRAERAEDVDRVMAFQFNYCAIKSYFCFRCISDILWFQFNYCAIKSQFINIGNGFLVIDFNSTIVRLREDIHIWLTGQNDYFNSTIVRLRDSCAVLISKELYYFNSTIVRLRVV